ncbi:MAG: MBL fold metallo-hydrolase [Bacteroidota bacterium]|nr:MBL fold metallo-hydrolase [Bacteroidota bacterium]MDP4211282.1 MBL fold metallo-hydrolase [Bacteroidota bacterium]MDP4250029.1 MBL fold metallo-hydrolase [Bacteroidota bacterium]
MNLHIISDGYFKLDGGAMFGVVPKSIWNRTNPADENNLCSWALRCLLIEDGNRLILVDNGIGDKQDARFFSHYYLHGNERLDDSLKKKGFRKEDVTDVFLTHLHFDHCGGSIVRSGDRLIPAFPNAVYWSNEKHWEWATQPNEREKASFLKDNILPIKHSGQLQLIPVSDKAEENRLPVTDFLPGFRIRFVSGHTESMMLPEIDYKGRTIVFAADLFPSVSHLPLPYVMAYDMFPLKTLQEKKSFLAEALENDLVLFFEHDPVNECCTVQQTEKGIRVKDIFRLVDL